MIRSDESGVVGTHAVISGNAAGAILRLLGNWRPRYPQLGLPTSEFMAVAEAVQVLAEARRAISGPGTSEAGGSANGSSSETWLSSRQVADEVGLSVRRVTSLAGELQAVDVGGRWLFPPSAIERIRERR